MTASARSGVRASGGSLAQETAGVNSDSDSDGAAGGVKSRCQFGLAVKEPPLASARPGP